MKYQIKQCKGYWSDDPKNIYSVLIALGEWDGLGDLDDQEIFYYMDGEPLSVGSVLCADEGFVITEIEENV